MAEWTVEIRISQQDGWDIPEQDTIDSFLDSLETGAPTMSVGETGYGVQLAVDASDPIEAAKRAQSLLVRAAEHVGLSASPITLLAVQNAALQEEELSTSQLPNLLGVAEVAQLLGVSRQRVSQLARSRAFPPPLMALASGPVWTEPSIRRHLDQWDRSPGRKARSNRTRRRRRTPA